MMNNKKTFLLLILLIFSKHGGFAFLAKPAVLLQSQQPHHSHQVIALRANLLNRAEAIAQALAYPAGLILSFRTGAALAVIGQPRLPDLEVPIGSRVIRLAKTGARVRLFYPCRRLLVTDNNKPSWALYCTDGRSTSDGMAGLVGFRQVGLSFLLAHLADASSGCFADAASLFDTDNNDRVPLLVYSHGYGGNMDMATYFLRQIAAEGIMVAAIEHTDRLRYVNASLDTVAFHTCGCIDSVTKSKNENKERIWPLPY